MRKMYYLNYLFVLLAWCLFLNDLSILGILILAIYSLYLLKYSNYFNIWRVISLTCIWSIIIQFTLSLSNISIFFPKIVLFMCLISFNNALFFEMLNNIKKDDIYLTYITTCLLLFVFLAIGIILPDSLYSIFTKTSLYTMICFIFLPYSLSTTIYLIKKELRDIQLKSLYDSIIENKS